MQLTFKKQLSLPVIHTSYGGSCVKSIESIYIYRMFKSFETLNTSDYSKRLKTYVELLYVDCSNILEIRKNQQCCDNWVSYAGGLPTVSSISPDYIYLFLCPCWLRWRWTVWGWESPRGWRRLKTPALCWPPSTRWTWGESQPLRRDESHFNSVYFTPQSVWPRYKRMCWCFMACAHHSHN